jgi:4'-phosphopantetheinyl transferase
MHNFIFEEIRFGRTQIHLCGYGEYDPFGYLDILTEGEIQKLNSFNHINRQREFVATRILKNRLFGDEEIQYDEHGAPFVSNCKYISISHCTNKAGIALNTEYKIGLDLESYRSNVLTLKEKFLSEDEKKIFNILDKLEVTKIWSAKEALYKLAGRKKIHFKTELLLSKNNYNEWHGRIINPDHDLIVKLNIFDHGDFIVSINTEEIVKELRNI